jgi:hypothetical protein
MENRTRLTFALCVVGFLWGTAIAAAQPLGIFRWQTQPFCNIISVAVTQSGDAYRLEGTDDGCGTTARASVIGMAFANADGSIGGGLTVIAAGGVALHVDVTILPANGFTGTWRDSVGRSGTFLFTPGASLGGPVRPHVLPATPFGTILTQPPGGSDRALSATVGTDTGTANDAAAVYGRFGEALPPGPEAPAGLRGESATSVGVYGRTTSGFGVIGGAQTGYGVQGHGVTAGATGVQAHNVAGGTALEINNGTIRVAGAVRAAFRVDLPVADTNSWWCILPNHPLLPNDDPNALVLITPHYLGSAVAWRFNGQWEFCSSGGGGQASVLVIKQ